MASQLASLLSHTGFRVVSAFGHVEQLLSVGCAGAPGHRAHSPPLIRHHPARCGRCELHAECGVGEKSGVNHGKALMRTSGLGRGREQMYKDFSEHEELSRAKGLGVEGETL